MFIGVHYGRRTYEIFFKGILDIIEQSWPQQVPDKIEWVFPTRNQLYSDDNEAPKQYSEKVEPKPLRNRHSENYI